MYGCGLMGMLWERNDFIGNSFPPEVCDKLEKSMMIFSRLNPANFVKGFTASEFGVMCCASDYPKKRGRTATVAEIAQEMKVLVPAVSRTLRSLQEKGYITREVDENDRRIVRVTVTPSGKELLEENLSTLTAGMNRVMSAFSEDEIRTIAEIYSKFAKIMEQALDKQKGEPNA